MSIPSVGYSNRTIVNISQATDAKQAIRQAVGDISGVDVLFNNILVGIYIRPEKTKGGILRPESNLKEDVYQGKVGLVLKKGPMAFVSDANIDFMEMQVNEGDWIAFRVGDALSMQINGVDCRMVVDRSVRMRVTDPEIVF